MAVILIVAALVVVAVILLWVARPSPLDELARARVELRRHAWLTRERARLAKDAIDLAALDALREIREVGDRRAKDERRRAP